MADFLASVGDVFALVRQPLGVGLCIAGALLCLIGSVGVIRFPDFYTRLHAASITDTAGASVLLVGMAFVSPTGWVVLKLVFIWLFLFMTGPTSSHAVANAAYLAGLAPKTGRRGDLTDDEGGWS